MSDIFERQITIFGPEWSYEHNGEVRQYFEIEAALAELLAAEVIFWNECLYVLCNDLFAWGCADGEPIKGSDEIEAVWRAWKSGSWGVERWCCLRRQMRPQYVIEQSMKKAGVWDETLEALSKRETGFGNPKIEPQEIQ